MGNLTILLRPAKPDDLKELQELFINTISEVCIKDYTPIQIKVWISSVDNVQRWTHILISQFFIIAEFENQIVGFASLENYNYVDFLYVHKNYQRRGIADRLYAEIEKEAIEKGVTVLQSHVSKTALPFFDKKGFKVLKEHIKVRDGVEIKNYAMIKEL